MTTATMFCETCHVEHPVTAFPTVAYTNGEVRDYRECRKARAARTAPRDGLAPKIADVVDFARANDLRVEVTLPADGRALATIKVTYSEEKCTGTNALAFIRRNESVFVVIDPRTARVWSGSKFGAFSMDDIKSFKDFTSYVRMMTY